MSAKIEQGIKNLKEELTNMGTLCEAAIEIAVNCAIFLECDNIEKVYQLEKEIDRLEKEIENKCMSLLLQQNPFVSDFRIISSSLKMISDFERIGDHCTNVGEWIVYSITGNYKEK